MTMHHVCEFKGDVAISLKVTLRTNSNSAMFQHSPKSRESLKWQGIVLKSNSLSDEGTE